MTFTWFVDDAPVANGQHFKYVFTRIIGYQKEKNACRIESRGAETALIISDVTMELGGWYRCDASNASGTTQLKGSSFSLIHSGPVTFKDELTVGRVVVQSRAKLGVNQREQITLRKVTSYRIPQENYRNPGGSPKCSFATEADRSVGVEVSARLLRATAGTP